MNPNREEALFALALEKLAEKRPAFLDAVCEGDTALRARLEALLAAHEQPETLLATQAETARPTIKLDLADAPDEMAMPPRCSRRAAAASRAGRRRSHARPRPCASLESWSLLRERRSCFLEPNVRRLSWNGGRRRDLRSYVCGPGSPWSWAVSSRTQSPQGAALPDHRLSCQPRGQPSEVGAGALCSFNVFGAGARRCQLFTGSSN